MRRSGGGCQNKDTMIDTPLTEAEFNRLDQFLMSEEVPSNTMDSSMLDGYLAAVASGPNLVMPDQMLRWVWDTEDGEESPEFKRNKEANDIIGFIIRHYQYVNTSLNDGTYEPRLIEREHEGRSIPIIDAWCVGYYVAIAADIGAWTPLLVAQPRLFSTILLYGTQDGWETLKNQRLSADAHEAAADSLTDSAQRIHAVWLKQRRQGLDRGVAPRIMPPHRPVRNPVKVSRNETCPCGSGKKYKHCHGGPTADGPSPEKHRIH